MAWSPELLPGDGLSVGGETPSHEDGYSWSRAGLLPELIALIYCTTRAWISSCRVVRHLTATSYFAALDMLTRLRKEIARFRLGSG